MSSRSDQYGDEAYRDETERGRSDDPYAEADEGQGWFPVYPSWGWGGAWGVLPWTAREDELAGEEYEDAAHDPYGETEVDEGGDIGSLWDEGLITLLIVGGAILFLFPEPATSGVGVLLMGVGVIAWLIDWAT